VIRLSPSNDLNSLAATDKALDGELEVEDDEEDLVDLDDVEDIELEDDED